LAKPTKYATPICLALSALAAVGIVFGLLGYPVPLFICLLPTVIYEVYRTQGESTKWVSWALLILVVLELVFILADLNLDLGTFFREEEKYVGGYYVPLGDVKVVGLAAQAVLAVILFTRTRGVYTKWLAVIIFLTAFAAVYALDATYFERLLRLGTDEALRQTY